MTTTEPKTARRMPPPPIEHRAPDCSICGEETHWDEGGFACEPCGAWWSEDSVGREIPGEWSDETEAQCRWVIQPWANNPAYAFLRPHTYRCLKAEGHEASNDRDVQWHLGARIDREQAAPSWDTYQWLPDASYLRTHPPKVWQVEVPEDEPEPEPAGDVDEGEGLVPAVVTVELPPFTEEA